MNSYRSLTRRWTAITIAVAASLTHVSGAIAQRTDFDRSTALPNLVPASVSNVTSGPLTIDDNSVMKQRFRICARNAGFLTAGQPWRIIISYPDDKGGRPNTYYWSAHDVNVQLKSGTEYCFEKDIWITYCRATDPRIAVSVDTQRQISEGNEDDNRVEFYPPVICAGG